ncbi:metallo-beta-lactamase superfamily domain-containing protein [Ceratobasidium sp. AG-Ba]|nr:metallo-beta-lactamase superfamily domain-containing protein [Ceratobasidium sp. AG-Ba]
MELPNIQQLSPLVTRILGQNPGKFTLQGTNTYLIGRSSPFVLIDTGEVNKPEYIAHLRSHLDQSTSSHPETCPISDIIITHKHLDHHGGLPDVLSHLLARRKGSAWTPPRIHIHPLPHGTSDPSLARTIAQLQEGSYTSNSTSAFFALSDGTKIRTKDESAELEIVHTPGHTADSICLIARSISSSGSTPEALFTADTVLGAGTAVFEDLTTYIPSLRRLVGLSDVWPVPIYPGHGPIVASESAKSYIETYISHREAREKQIIDVLNKQGGCLSVRGIVKSIYAEYPESLWAAAAHGIGLHLKKLEVESRAKRIDGLVSRSGPGAVDGERLETVGAAGMDVEWELVNPPTN